MFGELIIGDHHQRSTAVIVHLHDRNVAEAAMVIIALFAFPIDALGHLLRDSPHPDLEPEMIAVFDFHVYFS
jgi:hypothetical protein